VPNSNNRKSDADIVAELFLTGPRRAGDVRDVTRAYPWVSAGRIFFVSDWSRHRMLVVATVGGDEHPVSLTGSTGAVSRFLSRQFGGRFPGIGRSEDVAQLLKDAMIGPSAVIATEEFWEHQRDRIAGWLKGREKDPSAFKRLCTGIQGYERQNEWTIRFNVFNASGGVESVSASGTAVPLTVRRIDVEPVKPKGEFHNPLEG
jgi:hypothetical protein